MKATAADHHQDGLGKFEFLLVVSLIAVCAIALLQRIAHIDGEAERTEVDLTLRHIRISIQWTIGQHMMHGQDSRVAELDTTNPLDLLIDPPRGYRPGKAYPEAPGEWTWNPVHREIAYRPRHPRAFDDREELRWRYEARTADDGRPLGPVLVPAPR